MELERATGTLSDRARDFGHATTREMSAPKLKRGPTPYALLVSTHAAYAAVCTRVEQHSFFDQLDLHSVSTSLAAIVNCPLLHSVGHFDLDQHRCQLYPEHRSFQPLPLEPRPAMCVALSNTALLTPRSSEPYDPYIPSGSSAGPSSGAGGNNPQSQKVRDCRRSANVTDRRHPSSD